MKKILKDKFVDVDLLLEILKTEIVAQWRM